MGYETWIFTFAVGAFALYFLAPRFFGDSHSSCGSNCHGDHSEAEAVTKEYKRLPVGLLNKEQILNYRGANDSRIFISVCGRIFDVTSGADFYGPGGPYNGFTGADATYMLATMSLDESFRNKSDFTLEGDGQVTLSDWISRFRQKYPMVGRLAGYEDLAPDSWREAGFKDKEQNEKNKMTLEELQKSDGCSISICGYIFDVASAFPVYDRNYGDFKVANNDVTVCLARNDFDSQYLNQPFSSIENDDAMKTRLKEMLKKYRETYPIVGKLVENKFDAPKNHNGNASENENEDWDILDNPNNDKKINNVDEQKQNENKE